VKEIVVCKEEVLENAGKAQVAEAVQLSETHERVTGEPVQIQCLPMRNKHDTLSQTCDVEELSSGIYNQAVFKVLDCKDDDVVTIPKVQVRKCYLLSSCIDMTF
jgi:hypothetical protein